MPSSGRLYETKCSTRSEVRKRTKCCAAMDERKRVQKQEHLFKTNAHHRFKLPQRRKKSRSSRLRVNGILVSEPSQLLGAWTAHFQKLGETQEKLNPPLRDLHKHITTLLSESLFYEERTIPGYAFHRRRSKPSPTVENETEEIRRTRRSNHRTPTLWRPSRHHF